ncbi:MAG: hypothetical protein ACI9S8_002533, partial [Chlamydiales bacterium]
APVLIGISGSSSMGGASRAREKKEFLREKGDEVTKEIIGNCFKGNGCLFQTYKYNVGGSNSKDAKPTGNLTELPSIKSTIGEIVKSGKKLVQGKRERYRVTDGAAAGSKKVGSQARGEIYKSKGKKISLGDKFAKYEHGRNEPSVAMLEGIAKSNSSAYDSSLRSDAQVEDGVNPRRMAQSPAFTDQQNKKVSVLKEDVNILKLKLAESMLNSADIEGGASKLISVGKALPNLVSGKSMKKLNDILARTGGSQSNVFSRISSALRNDSPNAPRAERLDTKEKELLLHAQIFILSKAIEGYREDEIPIPEPGSEGVNRGLDRKKEVITFLSQFVLADCRRPLPQAEVLFEFLRDSRELTEEKSEITSDETRKVVLLDKPISPSSGPLLITTRVDQIAREAIEFPQIK